MAERSFPFRPRTATSLEAGDLIAVPCEPDSWACLQVVELSRQGPGARSTFLGGPLPWRGTEHPTAESVRGLAVTDVAMIAMHVFELGKLDVVGNAPISAPEYSSNYRDHHVGARTRVWGWQTAVRLAREAGV